LIQLQGADSAFWAEAGSGESDAAAGFQMCLSGEYIRRFYKKIRPAQKLNELGVICNDWL